MDIEQKAILEAIAEEGFAYVDLNTGHAMAAAGLIELNGQIIDPTDPNACAARLTEAGTAALAAEAGQQQIAEVAPTAAAPSTGGIEIETGIAIPKLTRDVKPRGSKYPYADVPVGGSFHIPASSEEELGKVRRRMSGSVSTENKRQKNAGSTIKFIVRPVDTTDPKGPGVRVFREQ